MKIRTNCERCGKVFFIEKSRYKRKFCDDSCKKKYLSNKYKGENNPFFGKTFKHTDKAKQKISKNSKKYWSGKKFSKEHKLKLSKNHADFSGENHPNWKGGITDINLAERGLFKRTIRKQILKRDNYICQMCGKRGGLLHVDHIQPWSENKELRFSLDNCRTLCVECHYKLTFKKEFHNDLKTWGMNYKNLRT